jgi:aconitate hydratase
VWIEDTRSAQEQCATPTHHAIIAGNNYGQGSSRENAAVAPRFLGLQLVIARSFARIHWQNLGNFGVLPLTFAAPSDYEHLKQGDKILISNLADTLPASKEINATVQGFASDRDGVWRESVKLRHSLSPRQIDVLLAGGAINWLRGRR